MAASRSTWRDERNRRDHAARQAEELLATLAIADLPVDPFALAAFEGRRLRLKEHDLGDRFDGQLEYHPAHRCFVLLLNTKYDKETPGHRHPRTRFSLGHELGHYHLDAHRAYLMGGGKWHGSRGEFESERNTEREADAFAAALLMPSRFVRPLVNQGELTVARIEQIAQTCGTSRVSAAIRAVELSDFPCALIAVRDGRVAYRSQSECLAPAGCYPDRQRWSRGARRAWDAFAVGEGMPDAQEAQVKDWFQTYDDPRGLDAVYVTEQYFAAPQMQTLLILLTMDESDLQDASDEDDEDLD